jgi:Zn-dependent protease with chaperone function
MAVESAIGYALAFLVVAWSASAIACAGVLAARGRLARSGPCVERAAAVAALILGPAVGLIVVLSLAGQSMASFWLGRADHCAEHGHHLHLCWIHGTGWAGEVFAVVPLAMFGAYVSVRAVQKVLGQWSAARALDRLARVARPGPEGVLIAPSDRIFCFAAGLVRPRIYVSSSTWAALARDERDAVLAHERAHLAHGDLRRRAWLDLAALAGAPFLARRVLLRWQGATERLCDRRAAATEGAECVARALIALSRLGRCVPAPAGISFGGAGVVERVEALLADVPAGAVAAGWMARALLLLFVGVATSIALLADPLHHWLETLLGAF